MAGSLPPMTAEQRAEALRKGLAARRERAAMLAALKAGKLTLADVLADEDHVLQKARVRTVLVHLPGVGAVGADKMLAKAEVDGKRRLGRLGTRQRASLFGDRLAAA